MPDQLGVGVIGFGWMGRLHSHAYRQIPIRYPELGLQPTLVCVADPIESNRRDAVDVYGAAHAVRTIDELLDDPAVDVVSICSPNYLHREFALRALAAGKPVWIEKPMGVDSIESLEIRDAARRANLATAVGFNYRHAPAIAHLRDLVKEGALGTITNVRNWLIADYASSPDSPLTWRYSTQRAGAGVLADLLGHGIDLVSYVTGQRVAQVIGMTDIFIPQRPIPTQVGIGHGGYEVGEDLGPVTNQDYVAALGRLSHGIPVTFESSRVARGDRSDYAIEIFGTEGSARWSFFRMNEYEVQLGDGGPEHGYTTVLTASPHGEYARFQPGPGIPLSFDDLKVIEAHQFLSDVTNGTRTAPNADDACHAALVVDAIVRSVESGCWENVAQHP